MLQDGLIILKEWRNRDEKNDCFIGIAIEWNN